MITPHLCTEYKMKGVKSVRFDPGMGPIVSVDKAQCSRLFLDEISGGVWYQLDPSKMAIPMEQGMVYIYPAAMRAIQFNE